MGKVLAVTVVLLALVFAPSTAAAQGGDTITITVQAKWTNELLGIMERGDPGDPCEIEWLLPEYTAVNVPVQVVVRDQAGVILDAASFSGGTWADSEKPVFCEASVAVSVGGDTTFIEVEYFEKARQVYRVADIPDEGITVQYDGFA